MKRLITGLCILSCSTLFGQEVSEFRIEQYDLSSRLAGDTIAVGVYCDQQTIPFGGFQLYIEFDRNVLEFLASSNKKSDFEEEWIEFSNDSIYHCNWLTMNKSGLTFTDTHKLFDLIFKYKGGSSALQWQTVQVIKDGRIAEGETMFIDVKGNQAPIKLTNGCVCFPEKE